MQSKFCHFSDSEFPFGDISEFHWKFLNSGFNLLLSYFPSLNNIPVSWLMVTSWSPAAEFALLIFQPTCFRHIKREKNLSALTQGHFSDSLQNQMVLWQQHHSHLNPMQTGQSLFINTGRAWWVKAKKEKNDILKIQGQLKKLKHVINLIIIYLSFYWKLVSPHLLG